MEAPSHFSCSALSTCLSASPRHRRNHNSQRVPPLGFVQRREEERPPKACPCIVYCICQSTSFAHDQGGTGLDQQLEHEWNGFSSALGDTEHRAPVFCLEDQHSCIWEAQSLAGGLSVRLTSVERYKAHEPSFRHCTLASMLPCFILIEEDFDFC